MHRLISIFANAGIILAAGMVGSVSMVSPVMMDLALRCRRHSLRPAIASSKAMSARNSCRNCNRDCTSNNSGPCHAMVGMNRRHLRQQGIDKTRSWIFSVV